MGAYTSGVRVKDGQKLPPNKQLVGAPKQTCADRVDKVGVDRWVHLDPPTLSAPVPTEGWLHVKATGSQNGQVILVFDDDSQLVDAPDRLVRIGWM